MTDSGLFLVADVGVFDEIHFVEDALLALGEACVGMRGIHGARVGK